MRSTVPVRITLIKPPPGVAFCLEDRKHLHTAHQLSTGDDLTFELFIDLDEDGGIHGPFSMGPPAKRFIYICSGARAGQLDTPWTRRAKIPLTGLPKPVPPGARLECSIDGCAKDGGPACATVPLREGWWVVTNVK